MSSLGTFLNLLNPNIACFYACMLIFSFYSDCNRNSWENIDSWDNDTEIWLISRCRQYDIAVWASMKDTTTTNKHFHSHGPILRGSELPELYLKWTRGLKPWLQWEMMLATTWAACLAGLNSQLFGPYYKILISLQEVTNSFQVLG